MAMIQGYKGENQLLSATSFQTMMRNQFDEPPLVSSIKAPEGRSGLFWDIFGKEGRGDIGHSGSDPGILSFMYFDPEKGIGCLLMTNTDSGGEDTKTVVEMWELLIKNRVDLGVRP